MFHLLAIDTLHESIFELVKHLPNVNFVYQPDWQRPQILQEIAQFDGLVVRSKTKIDQEFFQSAKRLKIIARAGSGLDLIDLKAAKNHNVVCINAPEGNRDAVAEHTLGLILSLLHKTTQGNEQVRTHKWLREQNRGNELKNKTVGIIGYGNVGSEVANRLMAFGCKILAYDIRPKEHYPAGVHQATMQDIFEQADILTLHVPLTEDTKGMVNQVYLENFSKPIWLINTSRGEVVSLSAVCEALEIGKLLGAGLDVLENEKIDQLTPSQKHTFEYLIGHQNTILTPHIAGWTFESYQRINEVLVEKIAFFLNNGH